MPRLLVNPGTPQAWEIELKPGTNHLGRGFANDFQIEDPSVSGSHCQIMVQEDTAVLRDPGSTNGSFVDGVRVQDAVLQSGQSVRLGSVQMIFYADDVAKVRTSPIQPVAVAEQAVAQPVVGAERVGSPVVSGTKLRISGRSASPPAVAAPTVAPSPAAPVAHAQQGPEPIDAGKAACKFHPQAAAAFLCPKCQKYFCGTCVMMQTHHALCRACGRACVPVQSRFVPAKAERAKVYSDGVVLMRCLGFGFGAALLVAAVWGGLSRLMKFDVVFIFAIGAGAACGYAVKLASQDRAGAVFSIIAIFFCLLAIALGKWAATAVGVMFYSGITKLLTDVLGVVVGCWLAWWLSGGDV